MVMNSNLFFGTDTYGRSIEVAFKDSKWYYRSYGYNGYGKGWLKWALSETQTFKVYTDSEGKEHLKWGWNEFIGISAKLRFKTK